jgi:dUTP pyrophosphatase
MAGTKIPVGIKLLKEGARLPRYGSPESAGADLSACLDEPLIIEAGRWALVPTGLAISLPPGFEGQVRARSGLALKFGIGVLNGPGTIDSDYRGEVGIILINHGPAPFVVNDGDRIAQLVIARCEQALFTLSPVLEESERGSGGFGSTGV